MLNRKLMRFVVTVLVLACVANLGGCKKIKDNSSDSNVVTNSESNNNGSVEYSAKGNNESFEISAEDKAIYDSLFDLESDIRVYVDITEEELAKIEEDYTVYERKGSKSPIYRMCNLTIEINGDKHVIEEVGVRMKGNTSRDHFYDESSGVYNLIHLKFSFDETFDDENYYGEDAKVWESEADRQARKDRKFASLNGLEMKWNSTFDATYLRETYAFRMYRDFGVLAPLNNISQCKVNDTNWGIFRIYEPVDKVFIKRNLPSESWDGDLYKCTWGSGPACYANIFRNAGVDDADNREFYTYDLKTNKTSSNHEQLNELANVISSPLLGIEELEQVVDTKSWAMFSAVSYMLGMPDDLRNNYNNHYVYFRKDTNQAVFIAYDCDIAMGISRWNPTGNFMVKSDPYSEFAYGASGKNNNPLVLKTLTKGGLLEKEYTEALNEVVNSKWFDFSTFEEMYNKMADKYSSVAIPALNLKEDDVNEFEMSLDDKYSTSGLDNKNMPVKEYMEKMVTNCKSYIE